MIIRNDVFLKWVTYFLVGVVALELFIRFFFEGDYIEEDAIICHDAVITQKGSVISSRSTAKVHSTPARSTGCDDCYEDFITGNRHVKRPLKRRKSSSSHHQHLSNASCETISFTPQVCGPTNVDKQRLALLQKLPGCEFDGHAAQEMRRMFPDVNIVDILRFLLARKGNLDQAAAMMRSALDWHSSNFPTKNVEIVRALQTGCFFYHGKALDGTPILFMRGAFYSNKLATPNQYVLAAAYVIDRALAQSDQISVTVMVHASAVDGAPNESADVNFIKLFVQVLSDNYPERLKRLVIYPFPWFARALWGVIKMFLDKRTQDKVVLISGAGESFPLF
jgi:CRAL/TRIO domain